MGCAQGSALAKVSRGPGTVLSQRCSLLASLAPGTSRPRTGQDAELPTSSSRGARTEGVQSLPDVSQMGGASAARDTHCSDSGRRRFPTSEVRSLGRRTHRPSDQDVSRPGGQRVCRQRHGGLGGLRLSFPAQQGALRRGSDTPKCFQTPDKPGGAGRMDTDREGAEAGRWAGWAGWAVGAGRTKSRPWDG